MSKKWKKQLQKEIEKNPTENGSKWQKKDKMLQKLARSGQK